MPIYPSPFPLRAVINNGVTSVLHGGGTGGGSILFSAGTLSSLRSDITFNNGGGVSFGLETNGFITASVAPGAGAGTGFTTGTTGGSNVVGTLGAGGLSMRIPAYLTTAMASDASSVFAGTGFTTATTGGTNIVGTLDTNGLSLGVPKYLTTALTASGLSAVNISAGSTSSNVSAVTFSNGGGVTFGFNGSNVTASVQTNYQTPGAYLTTAMASNRGSDFVQASATFFGTNASGTIASDAISVSVAALGSGGAGTGFTTATTAGTNIVGTLSTNGLSMGVPAYLTTAQPPGAYLTTAALSQDSSKYAGTGLTTASTTGSLLVGTQATNGLSLGVPAWLTTSPSGTISNIKISAGTLSANRSDVTFSNSGGVSFGLDTNGVITATVATNYAGQGFTTATTAGTNIVGTLSTNGLSMGVPAYLTAATGGAFTPRLDQVLDPNADKVFSMASNMLQLQYALGGSFSTNATRQGMFELDIQGNLTQEADVLHAHQHGGAPTRLDMLHVEADGANVTGLRLQMSASVAGEINQPLKFTTEDAGYAIGSVPMILGTGMSNSVANLNANFIQGKASSVLAGTGFSSATTLGSDFVGTLQTNGLSLGIPAYLTTGGAPPSGAVTLSWWENMPGQSSNQSQIQIGNRSVLWVQPLILPQAVALSWMRLPVNMPAQGSSFATTGINNSFTMNSTWSTHMVIMTAVPPGTLSYYTSTSVSIFQQVYVTVGAVGSNYTLGRQFIYPVNGTYSTTGYTSASTSANYRMDVNAISYMTGTVWLDIPFNTVLSPGNYWVQLGNSTSADSNGGISSMSNARLSQGSLLALSQFNSYIYPMGAFGGSVVRPLQPGCGYWSTNSAVNSTISMRFDDIIDQQGHPRLLIQFMNSGVS